MPVIKRYPNRKLYDTEAKQYITLDEIARLIREGVEVHVVDHASGEDLTALTLTQIIFEQEKKQAGFLPRHVLAGLIRTGGDRLSALQRGMASSLGITRQINEEIDRRLKSLVHKGDLSPEDGESLRSKLVEQEGGTEEPEPASPEELVERVLDQRGVPDRSDLERLMSQIETLASKLEQLEPDEGPSHDDDQD